MEKKIIQLKDEIAGLLPLPVTVSDAVYLTNIQTMKESVGNLPAGSNVNGLTLTQFLNRAYGNEGSMSFLHISDTHQYNYGIAKCKDLMDQDTMLAFTLITGDLQLRSEMKNTILSTKNPFLALLGNHDVADDFSNNQLAARNSYITPITEKHVNMGSDSASYWYKDIITNGATLRVIAFDEYEYTDVGLPTAGKYSVVYSEAQIRWFIELLKNTPSNYYLILAHHQPVSSLRDQMHKGVFISEKSPGFYEHEGIRSNAIADNVCLPWFIPKILDAYLNKSLITGDFYLGSKNGAKIVLNEDFSAVIPCKFLFHIGGHTHWDVCEYLPLYPQQLQLVIDQDRTQKYTYSDLTRISSESAYCINKVTLDFDKMTTVIERIGAKVTDSGVVRNRIEFPFEKVE